MNSHSTLTRMTVSRLIGVLFLLGFLVYGVGSALATSVVSDNDLLAAVSAQETTLALGVFLMLLVVLVDIGKAILFFPVAEAYDKRTALIYLSAMIVEVVFLAAGALALLMLIPLAQDTPGLEPADVTALGGLAVDFSEIAYQSSQFFLAFGALFLVALLYRTALVPRWLAGLGLVGYAAHLIGAAAELFGLPLSLLLLIPGALFEVGIAFWLIVKGFNPVAYQGPEHHSATRERAEAVR